jgi:hypothetical protein
MMDYDYTTQGWPRIFLQMLKRRAKLVLIFSFHGTLREHPHLNRITCKCACIGTYSICRFAYHTVRYDFSPFFSIMVACMSTQLVEKMPCQKSKPPSHQEASEGPIVSLVKPNFSV